MQYFSAFQCIVKNYFWTNMHDATLQHLISSEPLAGTLNDQMGNPPMPELITCFWTIHFHVSYALAEYQTNKNERVARNPRRTLNSRQKISGFFLKVSTVLEMFVVWSDTALPHSLGVELFLFYVLCGHTKQGLN